MIIKTKTKLFSIILSIPEVIQTAALLPYEQQGKDQQQKSNNEPKNFG